MIAEFGAKKMKPETASRIALGMMLICVIVTVVAILKGDLLNAVIGMSSAPVLYYAYRNPELLLTKGFKEFDSKFDATRDKKYLWGFPAYQVFMLAVILYIWLL
ncbi:MAG: hypothetical protein HOG51_10080 [Gammaproteobacteria bacterium]|jgi:hypothetical protein|nr:hypothetical protein [Gammaproteobacteria bacterium]MBT6058375.1 hypothetical protein [Gammaproteobacteria bacterium]